MTVAQTNVEAVNYFDLVVCAGPDRCCVSCFKNFKYPVVEIHCRAQRHSLGTAAPRAQAACLRSLARPQSASGHAVLMVGSQSAPFSPLSIWWRPHMPRSRRRAEFPGMALVV